MNKAKLLLAAVGIMSTMVSTAHIYPLYSVVTEVDKENDIVTVTDFNGNDWQFSGCEDWECGNIASLIMHDNGTPDIYDDIIIKAEYNGWVERR